MKRIFVVEDEAVVALELMDRLRGMGYEVCGHAAQGHVALRRIPETRPDLVLMDINLGAGLSGLDVAEQLIGIIDVPVIFLTAYSDADLTERASLGESFAYLLKPFDPGVLRANIELTFARRDAVVAVRASEARTRVMFEQAALGVAEVDDATGRFLRVNRKYCDIVGYSPEELLALDIMAICHPADLALDRALLERIRSGDRIDPQIERRLVRKDGSIIWVSVTVSLLPPMDTTPMRQVRFVHDVSERKRAEDALVLSESRYRRLFEEAIEGIFEVKHDGTLVNVNPAFAQMLGYDSPAELVGRNQSEFYMAPGMRQSIQETFRDANVINGLELVWRRKNGERLDVEIYGRAVRGEDGQTHGYHGLVRDVSEHRQHEAALHVLSTALPHFEGVAFFEEIARQSAAILGADIGFVGACQAGPIPKIRTLGFSVRGTLHAPVEFDLAGAPCESLVSGGSAISADSLRQLFPADEHFQSTRTAAVTDAPLLDSQGRVMGHLGIMTRAPVTHPERTASILKLFALRTAAELERQRAAARYVSVFEHAPDALLIVDATGQIVSANRLASETFGYSHEELLGLTVEDLIPGDDRPSHTRKRHGFADQIAPRRMGSERSQLRALRKDGSALSVEISLSPFHTHEGRLVVAAVRDTTIRLALEKRVNQRERLDALGTLAGGIAHDLNNALGPVMMATDILRTEYTDVPEIIETIERSVTRAAAMVRQILTFAKGTEGERTTVWLHHMVGEMEKIIATTFPKNLHLRIKVDCAVPAVSGDATQLHQVLLNLCVNARDAMPHGGEIGIDLCLAPAEEVAAGHRAGLMKQAGPFVVLRVRDSGDGISADIVDRIFDPFFTTKGPDKGTGLGLSTSQGIIKNHGGFISVASQRGVGTVFSVYLPAIDAADVHAATPHTSVTFSGDGQRVLYVDDDVTLRDVATQVLKMMNFTPVTAVDGTDGLLQLAQHGADVRAVITDLNMPQMSGVAFVRAARRTAPDIPIIVASGLVGEDMEAELRALGVHGLLRKPFTRDQLADQLRAVFSKDRQSS